MPPSQDWKNRVALVTGSARRVGAATVRALHAAGLRVVVHYRNSSDDAKALVKALNAERADSAAMVRGDLLNTADLPELAEKAVACFGRLDVLVNNASSFYPTAVGHITEEHWDDLLGSNLKAPLFLSQALASELQANAGCIVNMVDIHGMKPLSGHPVYSVAKAGLIMLTKSLARELGPEVRVNGVAPGAILWPEQGLSEDEQAEILSRTALKRTGEPDDIARTIVFLVTQAGYITGQILPVDGGRTVVG